LSCQSPPFHPPEESCSLVDSTFIKPYVNSFVELFVAVDALGILPIYASFVEGTSRESRKNLIRGCLLTAFVVGLLFLSLGKAVFALVGITLGDFQIAGGLILILIGVIDLVGDEKKLRKPSGEFGIVPLGIPLIVGPAVISVLLLLTDRYGIVPTLTGFLLNLALLGGAFVYASKIQHAVGINGMKAISKVMMLLLIGIGVRMIRLGILATFLAKSN